MVVGLVVIRHLDQALVLTWLICASCLCAKELAIELHLWVYGCWCTEKKGGYRKRILGAGLDIVPLAEGWRTSRNLHQLSWLVKRKGRKKGEKMITEHRSTMMIAAESHDAK